ncbi:uncharacterized protein UTRI_05037_B [Ustilago trichophora]|uniref:Elongin-A n=1 Tax=Ustilago trichophora TaxID=86804 RepID=A0A5C3EEM8_9BASI|nr:uncharacterized protein UTRI_05037_B [Ustilago trichophora]
MKDWRRSPEPPGMMGLKEPAYQAQGNWGQPEELHQPDFDPASPLPNTTPTIFLSTDVHTSRHPAAPPRTTGLSLYTMCLRVILRNISSVQDLGDMPYRNAKPILEECRIDQLIALEETSPHLLEHTEEIWKRNCLRDFIDLRKKYTPGVGATAKEPKSWRRLYFRTKGEIEQAKVEAAQRIKDKYAQHRAEKDAKKLVVSDRPLMLKAARSGGRRFGMATAVAGASVSKGQSLINKARSGSAAQAKLTAPRSGRIGFKTQGRSKMVGVEIAPEAAGVESRQMVKPMVAPRRIQGGASQGLARMKEFSRPLPGSEAAEEAAKSTTLRSQRAEMETSRSGKQLPDTTAELTGLPRLKPHEVAAAPPLTPSSSSSSSFGTSTIPLLGRNKNHDPSPERKAPSSPPPDVARTERRKLNFFGVAKPAAVSTSTGSCGGSPSSTSVVEVRGMKRAHSGSSSSSIKNGDARSVPSSSSSGVTKTVTVTWPPASSPTATSFFSSGSSKSSGAVRVVQAKRARTQASPRTSPRPQPPSVKIQREEIDAGETTKTPRHPDTTEIGSMGGARPAPPRQHGNIPPVGGGGAIRSLIKDDRLARASPAAISSVFAPSRSNPGGRGATGGNR